MRLACVIQPKKPIKLYHTDRLKSMVVFLYKKKNEVIQMNIAIYTRKSVYSDSSDSTSVQFDLASNYCKSHYSDYQILKYEDEGYSGASTNRPGYESLMSDIRDKLIDIVVCYKIDRISRSVKDFSLFYDEISSLGVEFVSLKENVDTSTPLGRAMMYMCSIFAQMERE